MSFSSPTSHSRTCFAVASALLVSLPVHGQGSPPTAPVELDPYFVSASPFGRSVHETHLPATVLSEERLAARRQTTLGATLDGLPGISATAFAPGASRPIVRGHDGERIRVLADGIGTIDVSSLSPDHAVAVESATLERVEIVRGPSALLYGSSAAGGVVNIIDGRIPRPGTLESTRGSVGVLIDSGADRRASDAAFSGLLAEGVAWRGAFAHSDTDDVSIPVPADVHDEHADGGATLENSASRTTSGSFGMGWSLPRGHIGFAVSGVKSRYGVPGHEHHDEEDEGEDADADHGEEFVRIDLRQRRLDLAAELTESAGFIQSGRWRAGLANYRHLELEGDETGTRFDSEGFETRVDIVHRPIGPIEGAFGAQLARVKLEADGAEAFLPSTRTTDWALFAFEEWVQRDIRWQLGARLERHAVRVLETGGAARSKLAASGSLGALWNFSKEWTAALTLSRTERAPSAQEWFADGPHLATATYVVGNPELGMEKSTGLDFTLRRRIGAVTGSASLFMSDYHNYLYEEAQGTIEDGLPVYAQVGREARFHGGELEAIWHAHEAHEHNLDLVFTADVVRARNLTDRTDLPRIPPWRVGAELRYRNHGWSAGLHVRHAARQTHTAPGEEESAAYTLVGADVGRAFLLDRGVLRLALRVENATDTEVRPHTSFTREFAPLAGRNWIASARWEF